MPQFQSQRLPGGLQEPLESRHWLPSPHKSPYPFHPGSLRAFAPVNSPPEMLPHPCVTCFSPPQLCV
jgi:hypothetical protein